MSDGNDDYRDELAAAHARIEALEEQLSLTNVGSGILDRKVQELETRRAAAAKAADPKNIRKLAIVAALLPLLLFSAPAVGILWSVPNASLTEILPLAAFAIVVATILLAVVAKVLPRSLAQSVTRAENDLAEARRLRDLEREVGETRQLLTRNAEAPAARARIAADEHEPKLDDDEPVSEPAVRRGGGRTE